MVVCEKLFLFRSEFVVLDKAEAQNTGNVFVADIVYWAVHQKQHVWKS